MASKSVFVFFKQKTAYEMRISDWSSDVCSSDLSGRPVPGVPPGTPPPSVDKAKVGLLIGTDIGRSLVPVKDEIDLPVLMQALRTSLAGGKTLLSDAEADAVRQSFGARAEAKQKAAAAEAAIRRSEEQTSEPQSL